MSKFRETDNWAENQLKGLKPSLSKGFTLISLTGVVAVPRSYSRLWMFRNLMSEIHAQQSFSGSVALFYTYLIPLANPKKKKRNPLKPYILRLAKYSRYLIKQSLIELSFRDCRFFSH